MSRKSLAGLLVLGLAGDAVADDPRSCPIIDLTLQPATSGDAFRDRFAPQIVAWLEDASGTFVDTVYITQATGTFGIGNRPGRFDFNSAPFWPYGRRTTTFPVWSTRQPLRWQQLGFQDGDDNDLSHSGAKSSRDSHFCRPLLHSAMPDLDEMDALTCPSGNAFTDKGTFEGTLSNYPPRVDIDRAAQDAPSVEMFGMLNPFDVVSQPTPALGTTSTVTWAAPPLPAGNYVLWVEVSKEFDMNGTYNETVYPAPTGIPWREYGQPYRGQPSVIYRAPIAMAADGSPTVGFAETYEGYGDPDGLSGDLRAPDATISTTPGSGAGRLALLSENGQMFRVKVASYVEDDAIPPDAPGSPTIEVLGSNHATVSFVAPGDDGREGRVSSYEVRYRVREPITEANFSTATPITSQLELGKSGETQTIQLDGLLPETTYSVGIRAFDNCRNASPLVIIDVTTPDRPLGEVDACFVATAAYGSLMAGDVEMLRRFRDSMLSKTVFGELAIESYYTFGPALAGLIGESDMLRRTARTVLQPVVARVGALEF